MKKLNVLALLAALAIAAPASAQAVLGFHGGANFTRFGGSNLDRDTGLNVGASILWPLSESFGLQIEASYSEKGTSGRNGPLRAKISLDYIDIPVLLRYALPLSGPVGVHLYGGTAISFEVDCSISASLGEIMVSSDCETNDLDFTTQTIDFGMMTGAGIDYTLSSGINLVVDALWNFGVNNVAEDFLRARNRTFTVRTGVGIPLGR